MTDKPAEQSDARGISSMIPSRDVIRQQVQLPWSKAIRMAWRNLRVRLGRSLLVTSGIILAIAFLSYILLSDAVASGVEAKKRPGGAMAARAAATSRPTTGPGTTTAPSTILTKLPPLSEADLNQSADSGTQTAWMIGLALLVCFVGVLNAMLLSVTERFAEIGTMKCLGALDSLIVKLFLLESLFQGIVGTAIGLVIGLALAMTESGLKYGGEGLQIVPGGELLRLLGLSFLAGLVLTLAGALYPAWRAAHMKPVEAMRSET